MNQPFRGDIALIDVDPDTLDTVRIELAPAEAFNRAGLERYHYLTQLEFEPAVSEGGLPIVRITSREPIREPYLDFLVAATWPEGQLVRGYTVLLDPPVSTPARAPAVTTPRVSEQPARAPAPSSTPVEQTAPSPQSAPAASELPEGVDPSVFPVQVGPVPEGMGLWQFALESKSQGASLAQTAMALYRANQDAFIRGDINRLVAGETLIIPSAEELFALDPAAAQTEFQAAMRGESVNRAPLAPPPPEPARLRIAGEVGEMPGRDDEVRPGTSSPARSAEVVALEQELMTVMQAHESTRQETLELRAHIRELESQLVEIKELLRARNAEVARLQAATTAGVGDVESAVAAEPMAPAVVAAPESVAEPAASDTPAPVVSEQEAPAVSEPAPSEPPALQSPPPVAKPVPEASDSLWHALLLPLAGFAAIAALGLIGFSWWSSRRRQREDTELVSTLDIESEFEPLDVPARRPAGQDTRISEAAELSALADEDASGSPFSSLTQFDSTLDEADPLSEADIYIAYGRYDEAVRLLRGELDAAPERMDLRLKLAEAYFATRDVAALEALLEDGRAADGERIDPAGWQRLLEMHSALAADGAGASPPAGGAEAAGFDLPSESQESISLHLEDVADPAPAPSEDKPRPEPEARADDFDLPLLFDDTDLEEPAAAEAPSRDRDDGAGGERIAASRPSAPETPPDPGATSKSAADDDSELMLTLEDLDGFSDTDLAPQSTPQPLAPESSARPAGGGEVKPVADTDPSEFLLSQWEMDSGLWDENATKLDLARAYLDMDDKEAARGILEEVIADGREDQRQEARQLLDKLG
ncbi:hypothetical protein AY586_14140 [Marichromatium gracile]|uniref:FimV N-terminal domain-containing protein n=1 Tax=Marichromatium gracile TaxID=1048 RepID=A0ABR5VEY5_MARGR|nr:hypothetical protein AY586_14140 [Marichromatium gracile]